MTGRRDDGAAARPRRTSVRCGYDRWAPAYDDADPSTTLDEPIVLELCGPLAGVRALDLGCGTGRYARLLAAAGAGSVVGLDLSAGMLMRAARQGPAGARWVLGDASVLPFRAASFDVVVSGLVLDHLPRLEPCFREVARVLRPGGRAVLAGVHPAMQRRRGADVTFRAGGEVFRMRGYVHSPRQVRAALAAAGLDVVAEREPAIDAAAAERRPAWRERIGEPALMIFGAAKRR
ncbi:MAG TPA: methyltransferase domain-containing protein [Longimicrobiales bacterium]